MVRVIGSICGHHNQKGGMIGYTSALLDELREHTTGLNDQRRRVLMRELLSGRTMNDTNDMARGEHPDQLNLFGLKELVESDDELKALSLADIAGVYGVSEVSLQRYVRAGRLRATRFGRKYLVTVAELKRFLATPKLSAKPRPTTAH